MDTEILDKIYSKISIVREDVAGMKSDITNIKQNVIKQNGNVAKHAESIKGINAILDTNKGFLEGKSKVIACGMTVIALIMTGIAIIKSWQRVINC